jgi:hypothetical protein
MATAFATRPARGRKDWKIRVAAVEVVPDERGWTLRLTDRATCLELALVRLAYGAEITGEDARGMILTPRSGLPCPTREQLAEALELVRGGATSGR